MRHKPAMLAGLAALLLSTIVFATPAHAGVPVGQFGGGCINARQPNPQTYTEWLVPDQCLYEGDRVMSRASTTNCPRGECVYWLVYQSDGNLVEYVKYWWQEGPGAYARTDAKWASGTGYHGAGFTRMQGDGNLVIHGGDGLAKWASGTGCHGASSLKMQTDGNLVIYRLGDWAPTWEQGRTLSPRCGPAVS